jgi:hypothetical protein
LSGANRDADASPGLGPVCTGGAAVAKGVDIRTVVVRAPGLGQKHSMWASVPTTGNSRILGSAPVSTDLCFLALV